MQNMAGILRSTLAAVNDRQHQFKENKKWKDSSSTLSSLLHENRKQKIAVKRKHAANRKLLQEEMWGKRRVKADNEGATPQIERRQ